MRRRSRLAALLWAAAAALGAACLAPIPAGAGSSQNPNDFALPNVPDRRVSSRHVRSAEGAEYVIFTSVPLGKPPPRGYPVLYVLDGNTWFAVAAALTRVLADETPCIVVGVGYPFADIAAGRQRTYDSTMDSPIPAQMPMMASFKTGGAETFLRFIEHTLKPQIERRYPIDKSRQALFGHSLTALFVLHALYTEPQAFSLFIAASPAIWWGDFAIHSQEKVFEAKPLPTSPPRVLITVGGNEGTLSTELEKKLRAEFTAHPEARGEKSVDEIIALYKRIADTARMVDAAREMSTRLRAHGLETKFYAYEDEEHTTEPPHALTRGLVMLSAAE